MSNEETTQPPQVGGSALNDGLDAKTLWIAICNEAECVFLPGEDGGKRLLLTEKMRTLMNAALGIT